MNEMQTKAKLRFHLTSASVVIVKEMHESKSW